MVPALAWWRAQRIEDDGRLENESRDTRWLTAQQRNERQHSEETTCVSMLLPNALAYLVSVP